MNISLSKKVAVLKHLLNREQTGTIACRAKFGSLIEAAEAVVTDPVLIDVLKTFERIDRDPEIVHDIPTEYWVRAARRATNPPQKYYLARDAEMTVDEVLATGGVWTGGWALQVHGNLTAEVLAKIHFGDIPQGEGRAWPNRGVPKRRPVGA